MNTKKKAILFGSFMIAIFGNAQIELSVFDDDTGVYLASIHESSKVDPKNFDSERIAMFSKVNNPKEVNSHLTEDSPSLAFSKDDLANLNNLPWQGKKAAVILTYDDALNVHLDNVVPLLDSLNLKGTFYVSTYSEAFRNRLKEWKNIAKNGHELGNHTIFHPCIGKESRPWVNPNYDMSTYTVERMVDEIRINSTLLEALDGKKERTFAYTCGDFTVNGDKFFMDELQDELTAARAVRSEMHTIDEVDLYNMDSYAIVESSGEEMIEMVKKAVETKSLLIFLFHGVGGEHAMDVSLSAHKELLEYLKQRESEIWTAPLIDVAKNVKEYQSTKKQE